MQSLAAFILRSRMAAILVVGAFAVLSLVLPPLGHVSGGALALVSLRRGGREGLVVMAAAALVLGLFGALSQLDQRLVWSFLLLVVFLLWLPVILGAQALRRTRSLAVALTVVGTLAGCALVLEYLVLGDVAGWWQPVLKALFGPVLSQPGSPVPADEVDMLISSLAVAISGLLAATLVITTTINIVIGRWLQAMLYNPGGLREEFHALRLNRRMAGIALVLLFVSTVTTGALGQLIFNLLLMVVALFAIHGLALMHATVALLGASRGWLVALYALMLILLPQVMIVLSAAGVADSWIDFRGRLAANQDR